MLNGKYANRDGECMAESNFLNETRYAAELSTKLRRMNPNVHGFCAIQTLFVNKVVEALELNGVERTGGNHFPMKLMSASHP